MKTKSKILTGLFIIGVFALPSYAKIDGMVSKGTFFDVEKTIMQEITPELSITTDKYWEDNVFQSSKYRPFCMLSNKELYNLAPERKLKRVQRFAIPSIYNVSFKSTTVSRISLAQPPNPSALQRPKVQENKSEKLQADFVSTTVYEQAKSEDVDSVEKINAAVILKDTKSNTSYSQALDLLDEVTKAEPYNAFAFQTKGDLYLSQGDRENAIKCYAQALKLNPYSKKSCLAIAKLLETSNKELSQKYFDKAKGSDMQ